MRSEEIVRQRVDLSALVADVVSDLEGRIRDTGGGVDVAPLPTLDAEPTQMRQLFQNLIGNALKFHRDDAPPVVKVRTLPADDGAVQIEVANNGIGFDEADVAKVFAPFQRLHARQAYERTGIGLAICSALVERHGGSITAQSTPDAGSRFIIQLPRGTC